MIKYFWVMKMNDPFSGISELQKHKLFKLLEAHIYIFNKNEEMFKNLNNENIICILLEGHAKIVNINYNGDEYLVEDLEPNSVFGTNISTINNIEYQVRITETSKILVVNYDNLINTQNTNFFYFNTFLINIFNIINDKLKSTNSRVNILTKKSIRDKLLAFFENEYRENHSKFIYLSTNFRDLADYLSVNRSAMFRELKYLKEENFIKVDGKKITLLYTPMV